MSLNITNHSLKMLKQDETILAYMRSIKNYDVPSPQEELELVKNAQSGDIDSQNRLIMGHQRFVYALAKQYAKTEHEVIDYVNEGNIGLATAIETYNSTLGFRFITYASHYIRRSMNYYMRSIDKIVYGCTAQKYLPKVKRIKSEYFSKYGYYPTISTIKEIFHEKYGIKVKNYKDLFDIEINGIEYDDESEHGKKAENEFNDYSASYNDYETNVEKDYLKSVVISGISQLSEKEADVISMLFGIGKYNEPLFIDDVAEKYKLTVAAANMLKKKILEKLKRKISYKLAI